MVDFGQFTDMRTASDYEEAAREAREFYGNAPRITITSCGKVAYLDMDGAGYRCGSCFAVVGSVGECRANET